MNERPIACNLDDEELTVVRAEYARAAGLYRGRARLSADGVEIELLGDPAGLRQFLDGMIAREAGCCPFLRFALEPVPAGWRVSLTGEGIDLDQWAIVVPALFPGVELTA